jgi:hypothetical protein
MLQFGKAGDNNSKSSFSRWHFVKEPQTIINGGGEGHLEEAQQSSREVWSFRGHLQQR